MESNLMLPVVISKNSNPLTFGPMISISRRNYVLEIYGDDLDLARDKGLLPVLPRHERLAKSVASGDLIFVYVRTNNPFTEDLVKAFVGVAIVTENGLNLIDVPSFSDQGFALRVKYLENKRMSLYSAKFITKFVSRKEAGTQFRYGFFEILGSDAEAVIERLGLCEYLKSHVSA